MPATHSLHHALAKPSTGGRLKESLRILLTQSRRSCRWNTGSRPKDGVGGTVPSRGNSPTQEGAGRPSAE